MKKTVALILGVLFLALCALPVSATQEDRFIPTPQEQAAAQDRSQSGIIAYDAVADTDMSANLFMTAAIIVAAVAGAVLIFTVIVLVTRNIRAKDRAAQNKK